MRGYKKKYVDKNYKLHADEIINEDNLITEQWEDEQIDIFTDIILAALIKESLKNDNDEEFDD
jgi:hypothetical protein